MCMFPSLREKLNHSVVDIFSNEVVSILHKLVKSSEAIMELGGQWHWYLKLSCRYWTNQTLEVLRSFRRYIRKLYINTTGIPITGVYLSNRWCLTLTTWTSKVTQVLVCSGNCTHDLFRSAFVSISTWCRAMKFEGSCCKGFYELLQNSPEDF